MTDEKDSLDYQHERQATAYYGWAPDERLARAPAASITDGNHVCARCGEHMACCHLCQGMPPAVRAVPLKPKETDHNR